MSETENLPTYAELVQAALQALNISTTILAAAEDSPGDADQIIATAALTVAGAQVFATLAGAAAALPIVPEPRDDVRPGWGRPILVPND